MRGFIVVVIVVADNDGGRDEKSKMGDLGEETVGGSTATGGERGG